MNMKFPACSAHVLPDKSCVVCVNWLHPNTELSDFLMESLDMGPQPETHPKADPYLPLTIFKCSGHMKN